MILKLNEDIENINLIKKAIKGEGSSIQELSQLGYKVSKLTNPLSYNEVNTYVVISPEGEKFTYDNTLSYYSQTKNKSVVESKNNLKFKLHEDMSSQTQFEEETNAPSLETEFTTEQATVLDELAYLQSTEYEAIEDYDKSINIITASGLDDKLIASTILGIKEIRKDEEDHVKHLDRLIEQVKQSKLITGTNHSVTEALQRSLRRKKR